MMSDNSVAEVLISNNCFIASPCEPFTYASGAKGPIYCDNRKIISSVVGRNFIVNEMIATINRHKIKIDCIAGVATGGLPFATLLADRLRLPLIYVRGSSKNYGKKNIIEGAFVNNWKVLVVEDLVNQGKSLNKGVSALRESKLKVIASMSIVDYETTQGKIRLKENNCLHYPLITLTGLLDHLILNKLLEVKDLDLIKCWQSFPEKCL